MVFFIRGWGGSFYIKNKLNVKYLTIRMFTFCVLTKNLNWEVLTKNLVIVNRWDGVKDEKF